MCLISFRFVVPLLSLLSFSSFLSFFPSSHLDIAPEVIILQKATWVSIFPGDTSTKKIWRRFLVGQFFVNATTGSSQGGACSTKATVSTQGRILFAALAHLISGASNETKAGSTIYTHLAFAALVLCRWCENCQPLGPCAGHQEPTFGADDAHTPLQQTGVVTRMSVQIHVAEEASKPMLVSACSSVLKHIEDVAGTDQYLATK